MSQSGNRSRYPSGSLLALGMAIGIAIGVAMHNIGAGLAIGVAVGVALDASKRRRESGNRKE